MDSASPLVKHKHVNNSNIISANVWIHSVSHRDFAEAIECTSDKHEHGGYSSWGDPWNS